MRQNVYVCLFVIAVWSFSFSLYSENNQFEEIKLCTSASFPVGAYLTQKYLSDSRYKKRAVEEYSSITTGTIKMDNIHPEQNKYDFTGTDFWVDFAQKYGKRIHGHVLIRVGVPAWVEKFDGDSAALENLMKEHIQTIVKRYENTIHSWDVVNEAFEDDGTLKKDNIWYRNLGDGYIERAFKYAHEANPNALLFYNDMGHEYSNKKLEAIISLINEYISKGVPIHGIGMQMHTRYNLGDEHWKNAIERCVTTGLKIHISELDISVNSSPVDMNATFTDELAQAQREKYKYIFTTYNSIPENQKFGITMWGVGDKDTWIRGSKKRPEWPLVFDDNYEPKPAYYGVLEGMGSITSNPNIPEKEIKEKMYYSVFGFEIDEFYPGICIEKIIYTDNSTDSHKILNVKIRK